MAKATFHADYDHHWKEGGITAYLAGYSGTVRREVLDAAIAKNAATEGVEDDTAGDDEAPTTTTDVRAGGGVDHDVPADGYPAGVRDRRDPRGGK